MIVSFGMPIWKARLIIKAAQERADILSVKYDQLEFHRKGDQREKLIGIRALKRWEEQRSIFIGMQRALDWQIANAKSNNKQPWPISPAI